MKIGNLIYKRCVFLFLFFLLFGLTTNASAWTGTGTELDPYLVDSCGTADASGYYTLTADLSILGGPCITISANDVTLDGASLYSITNTGADNNAVEVLNVTGITIQNIEVINSGSGIGIYSRGTITNMSVTVTNQSTGTGILNDGGTITINSTQTNINTGGGVNFDNRGTVNGSGIIEGGMTLQSDSILDLSGGLTIQGTLINIGAMSITPATDSSTCLNLSKYAGSIYDGLTTYGMCVTSPVTFDAQGGTMDVGTCGTIISSGTYTLNTNLSVSAGNCITISANDVTLSGDSQYSITNTGNNWTDNAIGVSSGTGITIQNIEVINSAGGVGIYNNGGSIISDISGTVTNSSTGAGISNGGGTISDISGAVTNQINGTGISNAGTISDISGIINNQSTGWGIYNYNSATITINSIPTITNTGGGVSFDNYGTVNGSGNIAEGMLLESGSILDLSGGLTIQGAFSNIGGTITPATDSATCSNLSKYAGSIYDGSSTYGMCTTSFITFDAQAQGGTANIGTCGTITSSGTYTLYRNVSTFGGECITVGLNVTGVIIDGGSSYTIGNTGSGSLIYINIGAEVTIQNITIDNNSYPGIENYGTITDFSGIFNNYSPTGIYNYGNIVNISGSINNYGANDYTGILNEGTISDISGTINNLGNGYGIYNYITATITINSAPTITNTGGGFGVSFKNYGVVNGYGTIAEGIKLENGSTLDLSGGLTIQGILTNNSGATITPATDSATCSNLSKYAGSIYDGSSTYGMCIIPPTFNAQGGTANINSCGTIISSGTYTLNTNLSTSAGTCITINASDVILDGASTYSITNTGDASGISIFEVEGITIQNIEVTSSGNNYGYGLVNMGNISNIIGTFVISGNSTGIVNNNSITIDNTLEITNTGIGNSFYNSGTVNGAGTITGDIYLQNSSTLDLSSGLTILGTLTNIGGTVTPVNDPNSFSCSGMITRKVLGSINDGASDYAMCEIDTNIYVSSITVSGAGNVVTVVNGSTLQMSADILPADTTDQTVTWAVTNETGSATIDSSGLLRSTGAGTVSVRATANDGSNVYGEMQITITAVVEDTARSNGGGEGSSKKKIVPQNPIIPTPTTQTTSKLRDIQIGSEGNDVKTLQIILNILGYTISSSGPGSIGNETTFFGEKTRQALIKFQLENSVNPAIGYFGPKTRDALIIELIKLLVS